jgi:hypothetical protein
VLEYWMQNGKAALSLINYDKSKPPKIKEFRQLLRSIYQPNGKGTKMSVSLFYPIYSAVDKDERNLRGFAKFFLNQLTKKPERGLSCTYCNAAGAKEMASYVYPFITQLGKYPNIYSMGHVKSLNLCNSCMLTSFAANNRLLFRANSLSNREDYISAIMFFSENEKELKKFYRGFIEPNLAPTNYTNMQILSSRKKNEFSYDKVWFPEEFLAVLIDYISTRIRDYERLRIPLGAFVFSYNRMSTGLGATNIYDSFDLINDLNPFIRSFGKLKSVTKNPNAFKILFRNLRGGGALDDLGSFYDRRQFLRKLLIYRKLDWKAIENLIIYNAGQDRRISYIKPFISELIHELSLSVGSLFQSANNVGYKLGMSLKQKEKNKKRVKKFLYDFRRCRRPVEFLSLVNLVQAQAETTVYPEAFTAGKDFDAAKTAFLIGFANAIFGK